MKDSAAQLDSSILNDQIGHKAGVLFHFYQIFGRYAAGHLEWGEKSSLTILESYILFSILDTPGITASELVRQTGKTKGFISQTIKKLEQMDYIRRERGSGDHKSIAIYPTQAGEEFRKGYVENDERDNSRVRQMLLERCTPEEIRSFYKVVEIYTQVLSGFVTNQE